MIQKILLKAIYLIQVINYHFINCWFVLLLCPTNYVSVSQNISTWYIFSLNSKLVFIFQDIINDLCPQISKIELSLNSDTYKIIWLWPMQLQYRFIHPQNLIGDDCSNCLVCGWRQLVDPGINCNKIMENIWVM